MSTEGRVLILAREAGAAAALAPVAAALAAEGELAPVVVAFQEAASAFDRAGVPLCAFPREPSAAQVQALLAREAPRMLLTGTSVWPDRDGLFWEAAAGLGIPSAALLDHWSMARGRFSLNKPFDRVPDVVAVIDEVLRGGARELGFEGPIRVVGQPHLESVADLGARLDKAQARRALGLHDSRRTIAFVSEPRSGNWGTADGARAESSFACTEQRVFESVRSAAREVAPDALLIVKLHPLEDANAYDGLAEHADPDEIRVVASCAAATLIAAADVVTGMASMLLMESHLGGVPTLSVRPGEAGKTPPWGASSIPSVTSFDEVGKGLADALAMGRGRTPPAVDRRASAIERSSIWSMSWPRAGSPRDGGRAPSGRVPQGRTVLPAGAGPGRHNRQLAGVVQRPGGNPPHDPRGLPDDARVPDRVLRLSRDLGIEPGAGDRRSR